MFSKKVTSEILMAKARDYNLNEISVERRIEIFMKMSRKTFEVASENYTCCCIQNSTSSFIIFHKLISEIWDRIWIYQVPSEPCLKHKPRQGPRLHNSTKKSRSKWRTFMGSLAASFSQWKFHEWISHLTRSSTVCFSFKAFWCTFSSSFTTRRMQPEESEQCKKKTDTNVKWKDCRFINKIEQMEKKNKDSREVRKHLQHPSQVNKARRRTAMIFILYKMENFLYSLWKL